MSARNSDGARSWASAAQAQTEAAQAAGADVAEDGAEAAAAAAEVPQALSFPEVEAEGGVWVATYAPDLHSGVGRERRFATRRSSLGQTAEREGRKRRSGQTRKGHHARRVVVRQQLTRQAAGGKQGGGEGADDMVGRRECGWRKGAEADGHRGCWQGQWHAPRNEWHAASRASGGGTPGTVDKGRKTKGARLREPASPGWVIEVCAAWGRALGRGLAAGVARRGERARVSAPARVILGSRREGGAVHASVRLSRSGVTP